jgi:radical SAM enzyme (TIGR01210 family)
MCDLWRHTLTETVPEGAIAAQVRAALSDLGGASILKLYNAGSFFDPAAIPPGDYEPVAAQCAGAERVIVECHPSFLWGSGRRRCLEFRDHLHSRGVRLEVAIGLETVQPEVLARLNKRMTLDEFRAAAGFLHTHDIDLRVFVLLRAPWQSEAEGIHWAQRSVEFGFAQGATVCCIIPTRGGNGAMEALAAEGEFSPPQLRSLECVLEQGLSLQRGRVLADLWDIEKLPHCSLCAPLRIERIRLMNGLQHPPAPVTCPCGAV